MNLQHSNAINVSICYLAWEAFRICEIVWQKPSSTMHQEASAQLEYIGVQQWEMVIHESQHSILVLHYKYVFRKESTTIWDWLCSLSFWRGWSFMTKRSRGDSSETWTVYWELVIVWHIASANAVVGLAHSLQFDCARDSFYYCCFDDIMSG